VSQLRITAGEQPLQAGVQALRLLHELRGLLLKQHQIQGLDCSGIDCLIALAILREKGVVPHFIDISLTIAVPSCSTFPYAGMLTLPFAVGFA
jgi:hypothetical protein